MKFSLWNLKDWFEQRNIDLSYTISKGNTGISNIVLDEFQSPGTTADAVVLPAERISGCSGFHSALCYDNDRILFPVLPPHEVLNIGNEMINSFNTWENLLLHQVVEQTNLQAIFNVAKQHFPLPMALISLNNEIYQTSDHWDVVLPSHLLPKIIETITKYTAGSFYGTFMFDQPRTVMYTSIKDGNNVVGVLLAYESTNRFQPGDMNIFNTIAQTIEISLAFQTQTPNLAHPLAKWFQNELIKNNTITYDRYLYEKVNWMVEDYYCIASIKSTSPKSVIEKINLTNLISHNDYCCIKKTGEIVILIHLGQEIGNKKNMEKHHAFITQYYSPDEFCIGYSLYFKSLANISEFYNQALLAVEQACKENKSHAYIIDNLTSSIIQACKNIPNMELLIHSGIQRLEAYDRAYEDNLNHTFYTYLISGQSVTQTANALYIHRNTVTKRLYKINELLSCDIENKDTWKHLLLSYVLS
ncbi:MAG TPA: PucR family transcriptional regulator [Clostridiaceae bacterium]|nr:PucR family transcriptional regulator [Clostridiaceae bacterium]